MATHALDYISLADLRARAGLADAPGPPTDAQLTAALERAVSVVELKTRRRFVRQTRTIAHDGLGCAWQPLRYDLIAVTSITVGSSVYDAADVTLVRPEPHDADEVPALYAADEAPIFELGRRNVVIVGDWGCVEDDDSTPEPILASIVDLVGILISITDPTTGASTGPDGLDELREGFALERKNKLRSVKYAAGASLAEAIDLDPMIGGVLWRYTLPAPPRITAQIDRS